DVNQRGESLAKMLKPLLQDRMKLNDSQAKLVSRFIDDLNRGFAPGLIGDFIYSIAYWKGQAGADIVSGGIAPAFEFVYDIVKSIMDEGKDLGLVLLPQRLSSAIKRSDKGER